MRNFQKAALVAAVMAMAGLAGVTGCSTWGHHDSDRTTGQVVDDSRITGLVKNGLANEPVYKFNDVDVKTFNGVVQLSGFVNTEDQKQHAGNIAQQVPGVERVVNSITLKPAPTGRTTGAPISDPNAPPTQPPPR